MTAALLVAVALVRTGAALLRIRRVGCDGVSGAGAVAWVAVNVAWLAYDCWAGLVGALASEVCYLVGSTALLVCLHRAGAVSRGAWGWGSCVAAAYAAVGAAGAASGRGAPLLGLALTASVLLYGAPALVHGLRARSVAGLSVAALAATAADACGCLAYGASAGNGVYQLYAVTQLVMTLPVLARVLAVRLVGRYGVLDRVALVGAAVPVG